MGRSPTVDRLGDPWLIILLNLPALVIIVLAYVWLGLTEFRGDRCRAQQIAQYGGDCREGARALDPGLDEMAQSSPCPGRPRVIHVVLPQLAPYIAAATRSGLSLVWKIVLVVELFGRSNGVGFEIGAPSNFST